MVFEAHTLFLGDRANHASHVTDLEVLRQFTGTEIHTVTATEQV